MKGKNSTQLVDTHAHLASSKFEGEVPRLLEQAVQEGVGRIVSIACDIEDSRENIAMAAQYSAVAATIGVHPLYVHEPGTMDWHRELSQLVETSPIAAIGEIGLDYFHPPQNGSTDSEWRALQREFFEAQLDLAVSHDLPVVIHQRNSSDDVLAVLRNFPKVRAVLHCFTGTVSDAASALEMGYFLSFTGIVTFPNATEVQESAKFVPADRIMVETDSPYLAPVPFRGKRCEPSMVAHTAARLAELRGIETEELARITSANAETFFHNL